MYDGTLDMTAYLDYIFLEHHGIKGMHWGVWNDETRARYSGERRANRTAKKMSYSGNNVAKAKRREVRLGAAKFVGLNSAVDLASIAVAGALTGGTALSAAALIASLQAVNVASIAGTAAVSGYSVGSTIRNRRDLDRMNESMYHDTMWYSVDDYLQHYGRIGMKWYQHIYGDEDSVTKRYGDVSDYLDHIHKNMSDPDTNVAYLIMKDQEQGKKSKYVGKPHALDNGDLAQINPFYATDSKSQTNCIYCSAALALRRKGYDVRAGTTKHGMYTEKLTQHLFDNANTVDIGIKNNPTDVDAKLASLGDGSYGTLDIKMYSFAGGGGHNVYYQVENGKAEIWDGQINVKCSSYSEYYMMILSYGYNSVEVTNAYDLTNATPNWRNIGEDRIVEAADPNKVHEPINIFDPNDGTVSKATKEVRDKKIAENKKNATENHDKYFQDDASKESNVIKDAIDKLVETLEDVRDMVPTIRKWGIL